ncbi:MAG: TolC family protein [Oligoflexia bacterium]|nr:TolC family protein [Oligoflexia bacterium]
MFSLLLLALFSLRVEANELASLYSDLESFSEQSLQLQITQEEVSAKKWQTLRAWMQFTPDLSIGARRSWTKIDSARSSHGDAYFASSQWNLFRGGSDIASLRAAQLSEESLDLKYSNEKLAFEKMAAELVFRSIYLKELLEAQKALLENKKENLSVSQARYRQGKIPREEVIKFEVDMSQQEGAFRIFQIEAESHQAKIYSLFVQQLQTKKWPLNESIKFKKTDDTDSIELKELELSQDAAKFYWRSSYLQYLPSLDFSLNLSRNSLRSPYVDQWSGQLTLSIPIWSRLETKSASERSYFNWVKENKSYLLKKQEKEKNRPIFLKKVSIYKQNLIEARSSLEKVRALYKVMERSYRSGRLSANDLLIEQGRLLDTEKQFLEAQLAFHTGIISFCAENSLSIQDCIQ